ncbi:endolytic transglycosylase MltG [Sinomonas mesophila]|uniref:endolytic transglycosylase MltG n=1 Tax=Sinomonas mesophila TaxID=1531955 RepID=UPI001FE4A14E|nr:endolytic transglycosylase MltG [Sinomonas mesophila]
MDPKENTTPAVPERPLTRRELRERERAQQEAQQRMLAPQRRAHTPPPSAFPRAAAASAPPANPSASTRPTPTGPTMAVPPAAAAEAVTPPQPVTAVPSAPPADGVQGTPARHDGLRPRRAASAESTPGAGVPAPVPAGSPTSASMGWGSYPSSAGSSAAAPAPRSARPQAQPQTQSAEPAQPGPTAADAPSDGAAALPAPVPAASPATAFMPAVVRRSAPAVPAPEAPEPAGEAPAGEAPATRPVSRVPAAVPATDAGGRHIFPFAAQRFAAQAPAEPETAGGSHRAHGAHAAHASAAVADPDTAADADYVHEEPLHTGPLHTQAFAAEQAHHDGRHAADDHYGHGHADAMHEVFGEPVAPAPRRRNRRLRVIIGLGLAIALFVGAALVGIQFLAPILGLDRVSDYPGPGTDEVVVTVQAGSGPAAVANSLEKQGIVADAKTFLKEFAATGASLHPGDFTLKKEMRAKDAAQILAGSAGEKVLYFALNAGLRVGESLDAIAASGSVDRKELDALNAQPAQFGLPAQAKNLEGYLAPGEYRFPIGTSPKDILAKLVGTTLDTLTSAGVTDPAKQYEVLTIASIVQAEGGRADYGNVAGAVYNRLKPNPETSGLIQSDATVTYGLGRKSYNITEEEKADASNPYNTYARTGLPAGPIGSPGATAIKAAASPTANDYLYWVTVNLDSGETKFSRTYAEHLGYAREYERWCQANAGKCQ